MGLWDRLRRAVSWWLCALGAGLAPAALAAVVQVEAVRARAAAERVQVTVDLSGPVEHSVFTLQDPARIVVDLRGARLAGRLEPPRAVASLSGIRAGQRGDDLRVVLDLREQARARTFLLKPEAGAGHRLVVELEPARAASGPGAQGPVRAGEAPLRSVVVAIDAGHGGVDPGATGPSGLHEKDVVLAIARELHGLLKRERGIRPILTRSRDQFLPLRRRTAIARAQKADLFVSIHADAHDDRRLIGSSVYALSPGGASSEAARWLAERENAADLVGGLTLDDKDDVLASVLLDLSQTATIESSLAVGGRVLRQLAGVGEVHKGTVQQAGFVVLKSPDIPSILVETAYISNPQEEQRLANPRFQRSVARAIAAGVREYFADHAPPGTLLSAREHVISRGDDLGALAQRYQVTPEALREANGLRGDRLPVGKVLTIPAARGS
jgi:N-acetylmuramoyl-L-alanine amidase